MWKYKFRAECFGGTAGPKDGFWLKNARQERRVGHLSGRARRCREGKETARGDFRKQGVRTGEAETANGSVGGGKINQGLPGGKASVRWGGKRNLAV